MAFQTIARTSVAAGTDVANSFSISITGDYIVILFDYGSGSSAKLTGVTVGGTAMSLAVEVNDTSDAFWQSIFTLKKTVSGSQTVALTWTGSTSASTYVWARGYTGTDANNTTASNFGTSGTLSATTTADNCWLVGMGHTAGGNSTFAGSTRQSGDQANGGNTGHNRLVVGDSNAVVANGSTSQVYITDGSSNIGKVLVALQPAIAVSNSGMLTFF